MTQTSGAIGQNSEVEQSEDAKQSLTLKERMQRLFSFTSSTWLLGILVGALALGFDLYRLGTPSIWFDEAFSVELARQPLPLLWHIIWGPEPNMELYYLFLHFWLGVTSFLGLHATEFVVRFPSTIFAALSSVMVFLLGRRFLGITAGLVAAGLYILNSLQLTYAQQTRAYSLQLLLICIAWYALFTLLAQSSHHKRWWICYIAVTTLAIYSHLFTMVILLAQLTAFVGLMIIPSTWRATTRKQLPAFIVSLVSIGLLSIPMLLVSLHGPKTGWLPIPQLRDIYNLFVIYSANSKFYMLVLFGFCAFGLLVVVLVSLPEGKQVLEQFVLYKSGDDKRNAMLEHYLPVGFVLLCWVVVPIVFSYVVSQGSTRLFSTRYLVTILPALFLLVGLGVASLRWRAVQLGLALALLLFALHYVPAYYRSAQIEDWNSTVHWLQQRYLPGDGLVCYDSDVEQGCQVSVEYYLHAYPSAAHFTGDSPGEFSWSNFGSANPRLGAETAVDPSALAVYSSQHSHFFYIIGRIPDDAATARAKAAQNWLDTHYHLLNRIVTPTVTISWYARG
ncbi:MAG: glycosyltransferase family 39 protein [Ktedonobacteraceae bacterium]